MSRLRERLPGLIVDALMTLLCAFALVLPSLRVLMLKQESLYALLVLAGMSLLSSALPLLQGKARMIAYPALIALLAAWLLTGSQLPGALKALFDGFVSGKPTLGVVALYSDVLLEAGLFLTLIYARLLVHGEPIFSIPLLLASGLMLWFSGARESVTDFIPLILAMPLLFVFGMQGDEPLRPARETGSLARLLRALPVVIVIALTALALTPPYRQTEPTLEQQADKIRQYINDHFFFTDSRENFSLAAEGYQPMGEEGLGGKPLISNVPVLSVQTNSRVYLRGTLLDLYSGRQWFDSLSNERYGYTSARFAGLRDTLLDTRLPVGNLRIPAEEIEISVLNPFPSTIFVPQRLRKLDMGEGMVPYFNTSSELFITRNLQVGDSYTLRYEPYMAGTQVTDALALRLRDMLDARYDSLLSGSYVQLPEHLKPDGQVARLARGIVGDEQDPYTMAMLIRNYLKTHYAYTLEVEAAPNDLDFTAYFLFESKQGYCTYFATAMTVLARSVGLPSRYVEGFVALPGTEGEPSVVTGQQGHAWTEIYIPALGWVGFDATSSTGDQPPPPDASTPPPDEPQPSSTPEPQDEPSPEPTQDPGKTEPSDQPATPEPTPSQLPPEQDSPQPDSSPLNTPMRWWIWLLLLGLIALIVWRVRATEPDRLAAKTAMPDQQTLIYWQALMALRGVAGQPFLPSETLRDYAQRSAPDDHGFLSLADTVSAIIYGRHCPDQSRVTAARLHYRGAFLALPPCKRLWAVTLRVGRDAKARVKHLPVQLRTLFKQIIKPRR